MHTKDGVLHFTKTEEKQMRAVIAHVKEDMAYGVDGTFGDGEDYNDKEAGVVAMGIDNLEWILETFKK